MADVKETNIENDKSGMQPGGDHTDAGLDHTDARGGSYNVRGTAAHGAFIGTPARRVPDDVYNMTYPSRGLAVIINNKTFLPSTRMGERNGTDRDANDLEQLFKSLGFKVMREDNCTVDGMHKLLRSVSDMNHANADCFVCAILSHGEEGLIYGTDTTVKIDELTGYVKGDRCLSLVGKPKIFFIQACRGTMLDHGADKADAMGEKASPQFINIERIPTEADFLMAYSVVPGYFSWRNSTRGSWFIQALCQVFDECQSQDMLDKFDILKIMTRVNKKVAYNFESNAAQTYMNKKKQIPCITSMLTKDLYFTPK